VQPILDDALGLPFSQSVQKKSDKKPTKGLHKTNKKFFHNGKGEVETFALFKWKRNKLFFFFPLDRGSGVLNLVS
jgi:hypothetical protein